MPDVLIRPMQQADVSAVASLEQRVQSHPWSANQLADSQQQHQCQVLLVDHQVVGFCILQPVLDEANLLLMAVAPEWQGHGLGYKLLQHSIAALGDGCSQVFLEVRASNRAAIALYHKADFHQIDRRKQYYPRVGGGREDAVIMVRMLKSFDFSV